MMVFGLGEWAKFYGETILKRRLLDWMMLNCVFPIGRPQSMLRGWCNIDGSAADVDLKSNLRSVL